MGKYMLTTFDNPYNPFTDFENWFLFDASKGYNTCGMLARIADTIDSSSDEAKDELVDIAMDDLVSADPLNLFVKVTEQSFEEKKNTPEWKALKLAIESREVSELLDSSDKKEEETNDIDENKK